MQRFQNILCVVRAKDDNQVALKHAIGLAKNHQASLRIIEVIDLITPNTKLLERVLASENLLEQRKSRHLQNLEQSIRPYVEEVNIDIDILVGIPFLQIIYDVLKHDHDLVIKSANNNGTLDRLFGSDDMHLLRKCPCPVWLVKPNCSDSYNHIVAAVDVEYFYPENELPTRQQLNIEVVDMAASLALSEFSQLHLLNVWEAIGDDTIQSDLLSSQKKLVDQYYEEVETQHRRNLERLVQTTLEPLGEETLSYLKPQQHLINGRPRDAIPAFTQKSHADLLVLGTVARTGIPGLFMGNTSETILNRIQCSVLAIKPAGFETPVELVD